MIEIRLEICLTDNKVHHWPIKKGAQVFRAKITVKPRKGKKLTIDIKKLQPNEVVEPGFHGKTKVYRAIIIESPDGNQQSIALPNEVEHLDLEGMK